MSVKLNFTISEKTFDKLMEIKDYKEKYGLTGNDFAEEVLTEQINQEYSRIENECGRCEDCGCLELKGNLEVNEGLCNDCHTERLPF